MLQVDACKGNVCATKYIYGEIRLGCDGLEYRMATGVMFVLDSPVTHCFWMFSSRIRTFASQCIFLSDSTSRIMHGTRMSSLLGT
jgi:hypothetical protein